MICFENIMAPVWESQIIYDESLAMVFQNGTAQAPLLFEPEEILSVTSADKTQQYEKDRDWVMDKNVFCLTPESRIFCFQRDELIFDHPLPGHSFKTNEGAYSLFHEGHFFHDRQISVTYRKKSGEFGFHPSFCGEMLPKTMKKLKNREPLKLILYGDSISQGANASGTTLTTPFLPTWGNLVAESLRRTYHTDVIFFNPSCGGRDADWGIANAKSLVGEKAPDLAIIAFGMNDRIEGYTFAKKIKRIMDTVLEDSPDTEFILCATTLPNQILLDFKSHQEQYKEALDTLVQKGAVVANFRDMQATLLSKKRFIDLTGNNVNHPNDFMVRCHAQLIMGMLRER